MLSPPYRWHIPDAGIRFLFFNYGTVAVLEEKDGRIDGRLNWNHRHHRFSAGSYEQATRWVERFIRARGNAFPRPVRRRRS